MIFGASTLLWFGFFTGIILNSYLSCLTLYIAGKCLGLHVVSIRFFGFSFVYDKYGNRKLFSRNFTPFCHLSMGAGGEMISDKEDLLQSRIHCGLNFLLSATFLIIAVWGYPEPTDLSVDTLYSFLVGITIGILTNSIILCVLTISMFSSRKKRIMFYNRNIIRLMSQGQPMEYLSIPPLEQLQLTGTMVERISYLNLRFEHLVAREDYNALAPLVIQMEKSLAPSFLEYETGAYYNLIFYYCFIQFDPEKSARFYAGACDKLLTDKDSNGCRVLAYYQYFILKNPPLAKATAQAGLAVLGNYTLTLSEQIFEQKLLMNLINTIDTFFPQAQITQ